MTLLASHSVETSAFLELQMGWHSWRDTIGMAGMAILDRCFRTLSSDLLAQRPRDTLGMTALFERHGMAQDARCTRYDTSQAALSDTLCATPLHLTVLAWRSCKDTLLLDRLKALRLPRKTNLTTRPPLSPDNSRGRSKVMLTKKQPSWHGVGVLNTRHMPTKQIARKHPHDTSKASDCHAKRIWTSTKHCACHTKCIKLWVRHTLASPFPI